MTNYENNVLIIVHVHKNETIITIIQAVYRELHKHTSFLTWSACTAHLLKLSEWLHSAASQQQIAMLDEHWYHPDHWDIRGLF
jgi:hypothetical protein